MMVTWVVFAKAPVAGQAKTRLIPALGADGAAQLARRMLDHAVQQCLAAAAPADRIELCVTPDAEHPVFVGLQDRANLALTLQGEGDLGTRMNGAFERVLSTSPKAVLIGTDAPSLSAAVLLEAAAALDRADAVFVPALDGGYALVALRRPQPTLFTGIAWSTPQVMAETRRRALEAGVRLVELPAVADIDEPADLVHLPADWR